MQRRFSGYRTTTGDTITLVKLDKSGGCVDRDDEFMQQSREASIKEYFFGDPKRTLSPHTQQISFDDATIFRIREGSLNQRDVYCEIILTHAANSMLSSLLPGGSEDGEFELYEKVEPSPAMLHCILAVMYASPIDTQETIRDASVMGFVYISEVDEKKRRLKVLAPLNTRITDRPMIWGSWPEATMSLVG
jgi:polyribonucleotide 5'-hydroxyl-kinase